MITIILTTTTKTVTLTISEQLKKIITVFHEEKEDDGDE